MSSVIFDTGCVIAGEEWLEKNLLIVAGVAVSVAFLQVSVRTVSPFRNGKISYIQMM